MAAPDRPIRVLIRAATRSDADALVERLRQARGIEIVGVTSLTAELPVNHNADLIVSDEELAVEELTARELEVLQLMAEGWGNRQIAERLGISRHTVKFHVSSVLAKLGAGTRLGAVRIALRRGLIVV